MSYVITKDYQRVTQPNELNAITTNDATLRQLVEAAVKAEMSSWLIQRFDLDVEFQDLLPWSPATIYKATNRVYLDASAYNAASTYTAISKALALQAGSVYICTADTLSPAGAFDIAKWTLLGSQYDIFYAQYPDPLFLQNKFYKTGDKVFWKNNRYTAKQDSPIVDHELALDNGLIQTLRKGNIFPDDPMFGTSYWSLPIAYTVAVGTLPTNSAAWTEGDNRNQMFVMMFLDIAVYELSKRIAPNNVSEARHNAWVKAQKNLKLMAGGDINAQLPIIQPEQGSRIRYGGNVKQINDW